MLAQKGIWQGLPDDGETYAVTIYAGYIYALTSTGGNLTSYLVKINPATMTEVARWTPATEDEAFNSYFDGTYIYVLLQTYVAKIYPATMKMVGTYTPSGGGLVDITGDGTYLYVSFNEFANIPQIYKINPATMKLVGTWTGDGVNSMQAYGLTYLNNHVYMLVKSSLGAGYVVGINTGTMAQDSRFAITGLPPGTYYQAGSITNDGNNIYCISNSSHTISKCSPSSVIATLTDNTKTFVAINYTGGKALIGATQLPSYTVALYLLNISAMSLSLMWINTMTAVLLSSFAAPVYAGSLIYWGQFRQNLSTFKFSPAVIQLAPPRIQIVGNIIVDQSIYGRLGRIAR